MRKDLLDAIPSCISSVVSRVQYHDGVVGYTVVVGEVFVLLVLGITAIVLALVLAIITATVACCLCVVVFVVGFALFVYRDDSSCDLRAFFRVVGMDDACSHLLNDDLETRTKCRPASSMMALSQDLTS